MNRFATLTFHRRVAAPVATLWQAWTAPAARAVWSAPSPDVTVEMLETATGPGGREVWLCKLAGRPDIRCECEWLDLRPGRRSVNCELVSRAGVTLSAALVTADLAPDGAGSRLDVTVQLSSLAEGEDMAAGYRQGFDAGLDNLSGVAARMMVLERVIAAPRAVVWGAWMNPDTLPQWWGPDGFSCRTQRIDLRAGGEWVFDMIGPDGTVFPSHHRYGEVREGERLCYTLLWGENGPKHADAWAAFDTVAGDDGTEATRVTLGMIFDTEAAFHEARGFGAERLGLQTLGKLARFVGAR